MEHQREWKHHGAFTFASRDQVDHIHGFYTRLQEIAPARADQLRAEYPDLLTETFPEDWWEGERFPADTPEARIEALWQGLFTALQAVCPETYGISCFDDNERGESPRV